MAVSAANVLVGTTGKISVAPVATALPTGTQSSLNVAFADVGYISDAGVVESIANTTNKIKAWQNGDVVRQVQTEHDLTYQFSMLETNPVVLAAYYGNYAAGKVEVNGLVLPYQRWVLDVDDGNVVVRIVVPYGQIVSRGNVSWVNGDAAHYDVTLEAYPDPAYSGSLAAPAKAYKYLYDVPAGVSA